MRRIVAEQVDEYAQERIPEDEARRDRPRRRVGLPDAQEVGHQQEVLEAVVEHHRVPESVGIGKQHAPGGGRERTDDLAVDEVAEPAHSHQERAGDDDGVDEHEQRLAGEPREGDDGHGRPQQNPVRRQAAEPIGRNELGVSTVERPLVEEDLDQARSDQDDHEGREGQRIDLPGSQSQPKPPAPQEQMQVQETQGITQPVPPEIYAADLGNDRIDIVDEGSEHGNGPPSRKDRREQDGAMVSCCA